MQFTRYIDKQEFPRPFQARATHFFDQAQKDYPVFLKNISLAWEFCLEWALSLYYTSISEVGKKQPPL